MNSEIKAFLSNELSANKSAFLAITDLHPLLEEFRPLVPELSADDNVSAFVAELEANIRNWWTNPEKDIDMETALFAILFEYSDLLTESEEALVYGITKLENPIPFQVTPYDNLGSYDFANGYYAVPGVSLECCTPLTKLAYFNIDEDKYGHLDVFELEGYSELSNIYMYNAYLALHKALQHLYDHDKLKGVSMKDSFYFLIGEHDCEVQPLFVISGTAR
ncbi:hypothetical protein [Chitinophaga flava]|uniref:Uncharacterized protein n=1 Tax=Chitinophaga flava TaxID=2259036 RepID=A0A365XVZ7_9BACT|nr:hypothetical protein [Chitinophaga flava]RBL89884.1 hypothetical protein DF182_25725 [Chitinophaga flava]